MPIKQLKSNKACGPDYNPNEIFINGGNEIIIKDLHIIVNEIFTTETIPNEWKNAEIVRIYKGKGDREKMENKIGITLACNIKKPNNGGNTFHRGASWKKKSIFNSRPTLYFKKYNRTSK